MRLTGSQNDFKIRDCVAPEDPHLATGTALKTQRPVAAIGQRAEPDAACFLYGSTRSVEKKEWI